MCYVNSCPLKLPHTSKCPFVFDCVSCFLNVCVCFSTELQSIPSLELFHVAFLQSFYWLTVLSVVAMATWYSAFSLRALHTVIRCHPQSALPLLCPQPCEAHRSMGLLKSEASPLFISKTFNLSCFHSVGIRPWQPVWLIEKEASATSGVWDVTTARGCWWGGSGFYQLALRLLNQISKVHTFCLWPVSWTHVWNMSRGFIKHHNHLQCQVTLPVVGISPMIY